MGYCRLTCLNARDLLKAVVASDIGCNIGGCMMNILSYADDMVLLAPSWRGLQCLLNIIDKAAMDIDMTFNTDKTLCMIFNPKDSHKIVCNNFPQFCLAGHRLSFVPVFKYLGHIGLLVIDNVIVMQDDGDVLLELKCLFTRTNILVRRFAKCSVDVKIRLFRSYCICFFDIALWKNVKQSVIKKLEYAYVKSLKIFFNFHKFASVTGMLLELGLPSFRTIRHNAVCRFSRRVSTVYAVILWFEL